jgi:Fe2+ transport system protein FeoA
MSKANMSTITTLQDTDSTSQTIPLSACREGDRVRIKKVNGAGAFKKRLTEMGVLKGADITIQKYAPLRDPMELVIKGYHLSLRVEEAENIIVQLLSRKRK